MPFILAGITWNFPGFDCDSHGNAARRLQVAEQRAFCFHRSNVLERFGAGSRTKHGVGTS